jgi:hypothetical protein
VWSFFAPRGAVMDTRGNAGAAARGTGSASRGATTVAASVAEPLGQGRQGASRGIAKATEGCKQNRHEDMGLLISCALAHTAQAPVHHLEGRGLAVREQEEPSSFR